MVMNAETKALLVSIGSADIDDELLEQAARTTRPSAGPGAGLESFFFNSGGIRVRLAINSNSPLKALKAQKALTEPRSGGEVSLVLDGNTIASGRLEPALSHCPEQAYITISGQCVNDCKFCPVPKLSGEVRAQEEILQMVEDAWKTGNLKAISLTSGVESSAEEEMKRAAAIVSALRARYNVPIGVSIYPTDTSSEELKQAGATEIKYNVETMDPEIFSRVCPGLSLEYIIKSLQKAVAVFGRDRVSSNFIIGLGESDDCVLAGVARLADIGVIPILRPISPHPLRKGDADVKRPSSDRLLMLAKAAKEILEDHSLRPDNAETMCLSCTGCDITPYRDL
jgi:biotin synthase-related radical SAM superfamily protein